VCFLEAEEGVQHVADGLRDHQVDVALSTPGDDELIETAHDRGDLVAVGALAHQEERQLYRARIPVRQHLGNLGAALRVVAPSV